MMDTGFYCYLNIEYDDPKHGYWHARIGSMFEDNIAHARLSGREWAIVRRSITGRGDNIIIAQSKNWRDRSGQPVEDDQQQQIDDLRAAVRNILLNPPQEPNIDREWEQMPPMGKEFGANAEE